MKVNRGANGIPSGLRTVAPSVSSRTASYGGSTSTASEHERRGKHFDDDVVVEFRIAGAKHLAHPTIAEGRRFRLSRPAIPQSET
ncbi:MAG: hypothetical protein ABI672_02900 [Vicinamibacteria bacterium]